MSPTQHFPSDVVAREEREQSRANSRQLQIYTVDVFPILMLTLQRRAPRFDRKENSKETVVWANESVTKILWTVDDRIRMVIGLRALSDLESWCPYWKRYPYCPKKKCTMSESVSVAQTHSSRTKNENFHNSLIHCTSNETIIIPRIVILQPQVPFPLILSRTKFWKGYLWNHWKWLFSEQPRKPKVLVSICLIYGCRKK